MRSVLWQWMRRGCMGLAVLLAVAGCARLDALLKPKPEEAPAEAAPPAEREFGWVHKVLWPGETLSLIAKWYTGSLENWKALAKANPQLDPDRIVIGDRIGIPEHLLKRRETMPRAFIRPPPAEETQPPPEGAEPEIETEELDLFGPKK
jgi:hypothetical protein